MRHVKFSRRSPFGSWPLVRWYNFHICVPSGSFFCMSSGVSVSTLAVSSFHWSRNESRNRPWRAVASEGEPSSLPSRVLSVLAEVSDWIADEEPDAVLSMCAGMRTFRGEEGEVWLAYGLSA